MKVKLGVVCAAVFAANCCFAQSSYSIGLTAANLSSDRWDGNVNGVGFGYAINSTVYFTLSHEKGDIEASCSYGRCSEIDYSTTGAYINARSGGQLYGLLKAGLVAVSAGGDRANEASFGLGAGLEIARAVRLQAEYIEKEKSMKYTGLSLSYWF